MLYITINLWRELASYHPKVTDSAKNTITVMRLQMQQNVFNSHVT